MKGPRRISKVKTGRFCTKLNMSIFIKENLSSLGICKFSCRPADDKDDDIVKPERRLPDVFKTFVN